jgi:hypothetical protein
MPSRPKAKKKGDLLSLPRDRVRPLNGLGPGRLAASCDRYCEIFALTTMTASRRQATTQAVLRPLHLVLSGESAVKDGPWCNQLRLA